MNKKMMRIAAVAFVLYPAASFAQAPKAATYITAEEIKKVNAEPGIDHTLHVVDIGNEHLAVGVIHRGPSGASTGSAAAGSARGATPAGDPCGDQAAAPAGSQASTMASGITHDSQTEGYVIISGGGTLVTGGHIVNGRKSPPDGDVTKVLNGPSCSGVIAGADVVKRQVKTGDVVIIPAGVPHGWIDIA